MDDKQSRADDIDWIKHVSSLNLENYATVSCHLDALEPGRKMIIKDLLSSLQKDHPEISYLDLTFFYATYRNEHKDKFKTWYVARGNFYESLDDIPQEAMDIRVAIERIK